MKKRWTRLLAICVCLIVVLSACASAPSGESAATEESKETSALELSEMNAESTSTEAEPSDKEPIQDELSEPDENISADDEASAPNETISADDNASLPGDITITPIEPTYPEERETTLEKVLSFDIGIDGLFEYGFVFYDDPLSAHFTLPGSVFTDGKGTFYHTYGYKLLQLNDGSWFPIQASSHVFDVESVGNMLYLLYVDGSVASYDISKGLESPVLKNTHQVFDQFKEWGRLYTIEENEPIFVSDEHEIFTLSKEPLNVKDVPFVYKSGIQSVAAENGVFAIPLDDKSIELSAISKAKLWTSVYYDNGDAVCEMFDQNGNPTCRVLIDVGEYRSDTPCSVSFEHAGKLYTLNSYVSHQVTVGKTVFEEVFQTRVFYDSYGTMYLAVYYPDHCDIYRVNAGYTGANFKEETETMEDGSSIVPTNSTIETSASSVQWLDISRSDVETNADDIITLGWTIREGNLEPRWYKEDGIPKWKLELPHYLDENHLEEGETISSEQTGIPYCRGGYNGADDFESLAAALLPDGSRRMTGNISDVTGHQDYTLGLDCARFLCKSFGFDEGLAPWQFIEQYIQQGYGHEVTSASQLEKWDVIISSGHAMFYSKTMSGTVWVYDVSPIETAGKTMERDYGLNSVSLAREGYSFYHMYCEYEQYSAEQHKVMCASCNGEVSYEPHTWSFTQDTSLWHDRTCTVCGYTDEQTHAFTYVSNNSTTHKRICNDCGFYTLHAHTLSYSTNAMTHRQTCSVCGYLSPTELHDFQYMYDTTKHWRKCRLCDYTTTKTLHTFDADGDCTVCPYSNGMIIMEEPELPQDAPEVPTDDFIVLCVEPKEEFWESVQR